jgi:hypothetical protein
MKYAGYFQVTAEAISGVEATQLEEAMNEVIEDLKKNPVSEEELQKVKNQLRVQNIRFMDIMSGIGVLFYLGQNAALGDWNEANNNPQKRDMVTAEDVMRVADKYLDPKRKNVLIINSKAGAGEEGGVEEDPRFKQAKQMIDSMDDPARLEQMIGMFSMRMEQAEDPKQKEGMEKLLKLANEKLKELKAAEKE